MPAYRVLIVDCKVFNATNEDGESLDDDPQDARLEP